jgi:serine/threonine protein kinase
MDDLLIKCYISRDTNRKQIYGCMLFKEELAVFSPSGNVEYIDISISRWVEGEVLSTLLDKPNSNFAELSRRFDILGYSLLQDELVHCDIKPENIVVTPSGDMRFIDFDATWVPGFELGDIEELGTPSFSYPGRAVTHFDKSIDDFPIALITTMLAAMSYRREMFEESIDADNSLFYTRAVVSGSDMMLNKALSIFERKSDKRHYAIAIALYNCPGPIPSLLSLLEGRK